MGRVTKGNDIIDDDDDVDLCIGTLPGWRCALVVNNVVYNVVYASPLMLSSA